MAVCPLYPVIKKASVVFSRSLGKNGHKKIPPITFFIITEHYKVVKYKN
jgi:hypothetical protein